MSSPRANRSRDRARAKPSTPAHRVAVPTAIVRCQGRGTTPPASQNRKSVYTSGWLSNKNEVTEPTTADQAAPTSTIRSGSWRPRQAREAEVTNNPETRAPTSATSRIVPDGNAPSTTMAPATAAEAPALTPRMPGSAIGLRVRACTNNPAMPRAAPATRATTVRTARMPHTIVISARSSWWSRTICQTWSSGTNCEPTANESAASTAIATTAAIAAQTVGRIDPPDTARRDT